MNDTTEVRMYVLREAAVVLGVAQRLLRERIKSGEIRTMPWGNEKRIPAWELKRWQEAQLESRTASPEVDAQVERILRGDKKPRFAGRRRVA